MSQQFHHIPGILKPAELEELDRLIPQLDFADGRATATMAAKEVKNNLQAEAGGKEYLQQVCNMVGNAIGSSPYFNAVAQPKKTHPVIISKYTPGKFYGWHVDSPIMGDPPIRTDLAMTIFLSDPATYEGGELMIQTATGPAAVKPAKGDAILYPCQFLHCVNEIRSGERLAAVTWIQSNIQSPEQRQLLFELNQVHALISRRDAHSPEAMQLLQTYSNLFRMWADV
jgi:PKHD-type hydroxylase